MGNASDDAATAAASAAPADLVWGGDGLIPAVVQDADGGAVLMVGFVNREALAATRATGRMHFWSRGRNKLWRKGETSGHEQVVDEIFVNCEQNSLLVTVRQIGAVCHDGYPTCYYRRLEPDDSLSVVRERAFDPAAVYPKVPPEPPVAVPASSLAQASRLVYGALAYLRDHDFAAVSGTSARLRRDGNGSDIEARVADELRELAGVLDGRHRHAGPRQDALLEGRQVVYWVLLSALRAGAPWDALRPDQALHAEGTGAELPPGLLASLIRADADRRSSAFQDYDPIVRNRATLALVAQGCRVLGVGSDEILGAELAELRGRTYLVPYFADADRGTTPDRR